MTKYKITISSYLPLTTPLIKTDGSLTFTCCVFKPHKVNTAAIDFHIYLGIAMKFFCETKKVLICEYRILYQRSILLFLPVYFSYCMITMWNITSRMEGRNFYIL